MTTSRKSSIEYTVRYATPVPYDGAMTVEPSEPPRHAVMRISDIDRGTALTRLQQAELEGRLTSAEVEARATLLHNAKTHADLEKLLADLPGRLHTQIDEVVELRTTSGSIKRKGVWTAPHRLIATTRSGHILLDFTEAMISHDEIDMEVEIGSGSVQIVLPRGASADINHFHGGTVRSKVPDRPVGDAPHLRISGTAGTGSLQIKYRRRLFRR